MKKPKPIWEVRVLCLSYLGMNGHPNYGECSALRTHDQDEARRFAQETVGKPWKLPERRSFIKPTEEWALILKAFVTEITAEDQTPNYKFDIK